MRKPKTWVIIGGKHCLVTERAGQYRVAMNGLLGWTSIWADSREQLTARLVLALGGKQ